MRSLSFCSLSLSLSLSCSLSDSRLFLSRVCVHTSAIVAAVLVACTIGFLCLWQLAYKPQANQEPIITYMYPKDTRFAVISPSLPGEAAGQIVFAPDLSSSIYSSAPVDTPISPTLSPSRLARSPISPSVSASRPPSGESSKNSMLLIVGGEQDGASPLSRTCSFPHTQTRTHQCRWDLSHNSGK